MSGLALRVTAVLRLLHISNSTVSRTPPMLHAAQLGDTAGRSWTKIDEWR